MGSSGGGKTTLLSTLALRLDPNYMEISGDIRLNGREYSKKTLKAMSAYVMQDDLLHAELTVWETINYAAQLRMSEGVTREQRVERQEFVLKLMGIAGCRDTIGGAQKSVNFLMQLGLPLPPDESLADYLLDVVTPGKDDEVVDSHAAKLSPPVDLSMGYDKQLFEEDAGATSWWNQFTVLTQRNFQQFIRRPDIILMNFVANTVLALFICLGIWKQIGTDQASIATRAPSLFFTCVCQGVLGSLQCINSFPGERAIMLRERAAGTYHVSAYFSAKSFVDITTSLWSPILFSCIVYFAIGYQPVTRKFFIFMMFQILDMVAATSLATAVTCICVSVELSTIAVSCLFEMCRLYGGYYSSPAQIDIPRMQSWKFADGLSYIKYAFVGIALNELDGLDISCAPGKTCQYTHGADIAHDKGYDEYTMGFCA
eukprot:gene39627-48969_t